MTLELSVPGLATQIRAAFRIGVLTESRAIGLQVLGAASALDKEVTFINGMFGVGASNTFGLVCMPVVIPIANWNHLLDLAVSIFRIATHLFDFGLTTGAVVFSRVQYTICYTGASRISHASKSRRNEGSPKKASPKYVYNHC
jgi:hypothetical protein